MRRAARIDRRRLVAGGLRWSALALAGFGVFARAQPGSPAASADPDATGASSAYRWYLAAEAMRQRALSWGDQPYGAVIVMDGALAGEGPSRVVLRRDATAHAEREAIRDAQARLGRTDLTGSILYSTSRPCAACEAAAAEARVARMIHGERLTDAGPPRR